MTPATDHLLLELPSSSPRRVLDSIDDLEERGRSTSRKIRDLLSPAPEKAKLRVTRQHRGRRTGFAVLCSDCGVLPALIPKRAAAVAVAKDHVLSHHPEGAELAVERG